MALLDFVIDVSDANGQIDWHRVAAAGVKVAMIKATEGATFTAHTWTTNRDGAKAAGIAVVPYHFLSTADPQTQAEHFISVAGLAQGMAYALDWEGVGTASPDQVDVIGHALVEVARRTPLGYWGIPGSTPKQTQDGPPETPSAFMQTWERWVPRYREGTISDFSKMPTHFTSPFGPPGGSPPGLPFLFWQYTDGGIVDGINLNGPPQDKNRTDRSVGAFNDANAMVAWVNGASAAVA